MVPPPNTKRRREDEKKCQSPGSVTIRTRGPSLEEGAREGRPRARRKQGEILYCNKNP